MIFDEEQWNDIYKLAEVYYEYYGNLEVDDNFRTINGIDYDEDGINLGLWLKIQIDAYYDGKLDLEKIELLRIIGMNFRNKKLGWDEMYDLAEAYHEHYENLEIADNFITENGYQYDLNGENLGIWISNLRQAYKKGKLNSTQIVKLKRIGMIFENNE